MSISCSCTQGAHIEDTSLPNYSPLHISDDCAIMKALHISFHQHWCFIICCRSSVPLGNLHKHFNAHHNVLLPSTQQPKLNSGRTKPKRRNKHFKVVEEHLSMVLGIVIGQKLKDFEGTPTIDRPMAGIANPMPEFQCPSFNSAPVLRGYMWLQSAWGSIMARNARLGNFPS